MTAIQTHARIGADGVLRLEVPTPERDREVQVIVVVEPEMRAGERGDPQTDRWSKYRLALLGKAVQVPEPGSWNAQTFAPMPLTDGGPAASDTLVSDRR